MMDKADLIRFVHKLQDELLKARGNQDQADLPNEVEEDEANNELVQMKGQRIENAEVQAQNKPAIILQKTHGFKMTSKAVETGSSSTTQILTVSDIAGG